VTSIFVALPLRIMRRLFFPYLATTLLVLVLFACHSKTEKVSAKPPYGDNSKVVNTPLIWDDTTTQQSQEIIHGLDSYYGTQARMGFNGSVLVGYKGKIIYERYYGWSNREQRVPLSRDNAVQLASISKTFTGGAIMYLYQHKYLDINQKVQTYIKEFPYPELTLKMLLDHRSGLPDYTKWIPAFRKDQKTAITNDDVIRMFAAYKPRLEFRADSRFKYSNSNYAVLASIIERVTEMPFPDFMKKYIFDPLGMNHTFIFSTAKGRLPETASISYKYNWMREPDMFADGVYGDKNVYSTVEDMYRWDQSFYKNTLLSNETIEMMYGPCSFEKPGIKNYGLGWRMLCYPSGNKIIYHNGWWHGNNTSFYRFIQDNFTIIVLGNKYNTGIYHQAPIVNSIVKGIPIQKGFDTED